MQAISNSAYILEKGTTKIKVKKGVFDISKVNFDIVKNAIKGTSKTIEEYIPKKKEKQKRGGDK